MKQVSQFILSLFLSPLILQPAMAMALDDSAQKIEQDFLIENEKNTIGIFKEASPLVVSVDSTRLATDFFRMDYHEIPAGSGTGFIWDDQGHVITNFHVIQAALNSSSQIWVTTKDGKREKAKIIGTEPRKDIAVLQVEGLKAPNGFSTKVARSDQLQVGQKVLAIGNPFGFEQTLTTGIVSALDRSMPAVNSPISIRNMIQTDASINPGNSGGPLLDSRGYLTGMNTAIISGSGSSAGIGFAVPSNTIARMADQIIKYGQVKQPGIGISSLIGYKKMMLARQGFELPDGVIIEEVHKGSPAEKAGLKGLTYHPRRGVRLGDVITHINSTKVNNFDDLYNILSEKNPGDEVNIKIIRKGRSLTKKVKLAVINLTS